LFEQPKKTREEQEKRDKKKTKRENGPMNVLGGGALSLCFPANLFFFCSNFSF